MVLGFMQKFKDGTPTNFIEKILTGEKIHTIRGGERWRDGMEIHMATGVRTKNYERFNLRYPELQKCLSVQGIFMTFYQSRLEVSVDDYYLWPSHIEMLCKNDGITRAQLIAHFFPNNTYEFSGQIIHWTNYKY